MKHPYFLFVVLLLLFSCSKPKIVNKKKVVNPFYNTALKYRDTIKNLDSAFLYFDKAQDLFLQQKDSLGVGKSLNNMGYILALKGDLLSAQEKLLKASNYFNEKKKTHFESIAFNFDERGSVSHLLKNYSEAITSHEKALKYTHEITSLLTIQNNLANAYRRNNDYPKSLAIYQGILKQNISNTEYARTLSNFAFTKWLQNINYNAAPELLKALHIREKENDFSGQNTSYAHLADYYMQKKPGTALFYAIKMYQVAKRINDSNDQLEALQKLVKLSPDKASKQYFESYQNLSDSVQTARNLDKNRFASFIYKTEEYKAKNLVLQKDNTEKKYQIIKQKSFVVGGIVLAFLAIIVSIILYKKRKQRLELETQNTIRENQLKTSKKVHDVVANGLYRVMTEIENLADLDKDRVLDKIDDLYKKSRDISYEKPPLPGQNFHEKITTLLKYFETEATKVSFKGSSTDLWGKVNAQIKYEIEHILQEFMINMKKHSQATRVKVWVEQKNNQINIYYADNGVGIAGQLHYGNGLSNTGNRITSIHGTITFDIKMEKGLKIHVSFPVS